MKLWALMAITMCYLPSTHAMKRDRPKEFILYPAYKPKFLPPLPKRERVCHQWQDPQLLQHGAYLASVANGSGKELRISIASLLAVKERNEHYSFSTHENEATELDIVPAENGTQFSKVLFVKPTIGSNDISSVEGFCLVIEDTQAPENKKLLWLLRQFDYENHTCVVTSYFDHNSIAVPEQVEPNITFGRGKKIVSRINLNVTDLENKQITAHTSTFVCS